MNAVPGSARTLRRPFAGFLANRVQHALIREAVNMLEMGIASPQDIDAAIRYSFGFRLAAAGRARGITLAWFLVATSSHM